MRRLATWLMAVVAILAVGALPVGAHTIVQDAEPGPGETVTGPVSEASVTFLDPVLPTPILVVTAADDEPVPGLESAVLDGRVASIRFDALTEPGVYGVEYRFTSTDGHPGTGAHQFRIGRADASGSSGMLPITADSIRLFIHLLAATLWVGGQLTLAGLVPGLRALGDDAPAVVARRFNTIAWPAFAVLVATGVWNLTEVSFSDRSSAYQVTVFVKLVVVALSGAAAAVHSVTRSRALLVVAGIVTFLTALGALFLGVLLTAA